MSELTLMILRIGFLLLLWFFIFAIVYALRSDLFGAPVRRMRGDGAPGTQTPPAVQAVQAAPQQTSAPPRSPQPQAPPSAGPGLPSAGGSGPARHLVITSGVASGTSIPLDDDVVTIGRSADSTLVIVDEYTSTYHARLNRSGDNWTLTDLDSTNGTKVDGTKVTSPVPLPTFAPVTIGTTTFELRP
ncbi:FHA domain-containing protein [Leucobacter sp. CSA1]|uniref:FHA domain-containing protein n=1 Tax=Leucobacter chromiisoli TaxID=2796471 RepID=A0A934Q8S5_9MICO|nr:FHA domain-containing protein [Leucobacter chromiisoli]MBK0420330.1 FHA domain-containing protein [Leucobacter chromiisoli]